MKSRNTISSLLLCAILFTSVSPALEKSSASNHKPLKSHSALNVIKLSADAAKAEKIARASQSMLPAAEYFLDRKMREEIQASSQNLQEQDGINFSVLGSWKSSFRNRLHFPNNMHRVADFGITVNGADIDTIDAGETIDVGITFPAGTDSFSFDILALAESIDPGTSPVPSYGELSLFDIAFLDDDLPNGAFWIYPDSSDSAAAFEMDDLVYMGVDLVFRVATDSDTAEAFLKINSVEGDQAISGNVTGSVSGLPSMLVFQSGNDEDESWITFTSVYHTIAINHAGDEPFVLSAVDVFHSVDSGEYLFTTQQFPADESNVQLNITRNASVGGIVTESESDEPIEGLRVSAAAQSEASFIISYSATDSAGGYELPLQGYSIIYGGLQINHPNYQDAGCGAVSGPHYILPDDERELNCSITEWPAIIEGSVTDEDGNPLPGIMVRIELDNEEFSRTVVTNPNGNYRMGSLLGIAEMCANPQGNLEFQQTCEFPVPINTAAVEQDFILEGWPAAIRVEVTDEETDEAIPGSRVDVIMGANTDNRRTISAETNETGIAVVGVNNGTYRVCAENADLGYQRECQNQVSAQDDTTDVSLALNGPDAFIEGYVFDSETYIPIENLTIVAFPGENAEINQRIGSTDENGFFSIGAQNGYYTVCYIDFTSAYDDTCISEVGAENGTTTMPVMYLDPIHYDGAISGTISDQHDMGVPALVVAADSSDTEEDVNLRLHYTVSGMDGEYLLPAMNGTYFLVASPFNEFYLTGYTADVEVENDTAEADIVTPALIRDAVVYGTVTDSNLTPIEGAGVVFATWRSMDEILPFGTVSNENGNYQIRLPGFDDRLYWAVAAYSGDANEDEMPPTLLAVEDSISITSGDTLDIDFTLLPEAFDGLITGTVYVYDDPVSGVAVTAHNYQTDRDFETHTDENGRFMLEVDYGEFIVCAHHYAYENEECEGVIVSEEHPETDVDLEYGAPVESLDNIRGNFRFTFGNNGTITRGEWPAGSGRHYLNKGGLVTVGYMGESGMVGGLVEDSWEPVPESFGGYLGWITRSMTDSGQDHATYVNVQESIFSPTQNQNFIIIFSTITYDGDFVPLEGFRAGYLMDWDITRTPNGMSGEEDDLTGLLISEVSHPVLGVMIPIKISYMMDNDGDQNQSPGYVGLVTLAGTNMMTGLNHIVFDTDEDPESVEAYAELFDVDEDDENASEPGDYAVGQLTEGISISMGDTLTLTTIVMAAESPQGFIQITQQVLNFLYSLEIGSDFPGIPEDYALHQNYPNPFNPVTTIRFDIPDAGEMRLSVINLLGEEVAVLRTGFHHPGRYSVRWDAGDMASGMYFYRISTAEFTAVRKLVLMK
ncbi:MAG: T9SS type A sorting domain-containing protein [Candidatus Marinimicrobia bacterium]|nr:T9SS type A sorting domain-containing protein [Candidatus Neomarinimicrobiota bacterium]